MSDLRLIVLSNCKELGDKVNKNIASLREEDIDYRVPIEEVRFNNSEGKVVIKDTVREKDIYILCDVGNYSITYQMFGFQNHKSADDHFQDLKRVIYAIKGQADHVSVICPLLYESRQHRRKGRESLDCAIGLQDLVSLGVKNIITFDAHDIGIQNAIPRSSFDNFYPTKAIIEEFVETEKIDFKNMLIISPDTGAVDRARLYADIFRTNVGMCYKRRDLTQVVNGKNPIIEHKYIGDSVKGKNIIIVDDMIASGESSLEVAELLKKEGANKIYLISTFSLFTSGPNKFREYYEKGILDRVYTTNLTYMSDELKNEPWLKRVDCSMQIAEIIDNLNKKQRLSALLDDRKESFQKVQNKITKKEN